jgi:NAD(P)-dependent dehydrogenase (short-subunit alcohol dehydrogenase family)
MVRFRFRVGRRAQTSFSGKIAIVTGGASGIGRAFCLELARRGAVVVTADRDGDGARAVAAEVVRAGGQATAEELDVRDLEAFEQVVTRAVARSGKVDYLFNNAGIAVGGEADGYAPEDWDDVLDVNLRGVTNGIQAVYGQMIAQGSGHIVNTASVLGLLGMPGQASYSAAKHGVVAASRVLRVEAKRHGVRVSALCPGAVWTPILSGGRYGHAGYEGMREDVVRKLWATLRPITPERLATRALDAVAKDEAIIVVPSWWRALWLIDRLAPVAVLRAYEVLLQKTREDLAREGLVRSNRASRRAAHAGEIVGKARRSMPN